MSIFDGMAGLLNDVFGGSVTFVDQITGSTITVKAVFREEPIEVAGEQGGLILIEQPTVRVPKTLAPSIRRGDKVVVPDGRIFRIESKIPSGSPAEDGFLICGLEFLP